jgi:hypothetical protein
MLDVDRGYEQAAVPRYRQNDLDRSANQTHQAHRHHTVVRMTSIVNYLIIYNFTGQMIF